MINWDDCRFISALSHYKSMSAAAKHLNTNITTVSRRISRISESVGAPIFIKARNGWELSDAGQDFIDPIHAFEDALNRLSAKNGPTSRSIRHVNISSRDYIASDYLAPAVQDFCRVAPEYRITLQSSDEDESLAYGEADVALRSERPKGGRLIAKRIGTIGFSIFKSQDIRVDGWIGLTEEHDCTPEIEHAFEFFAEPPRMRAHSFLCAAMAARATGLACLLPNKTNETLDSLEVWPGQENCLSRDVWLVYHETRRQDPGLRPVIDWLSGVFSGKNSNNTSLPEFRHFETGERLSG